MVAVLGLLCTSLAAADQADESKSLVDKAAAMVKKDGMDKTLKAVNDMGGPFVKGDLYVWAGDCEKTTLLAHPTLPSLVTGTSLKEFKDEKGNQLFVSFGKVAKDPGHGWVEYWQRQPSTGELKIKRAFILKFLQGDRLRLLQQEPMYASYPLFTTLPSRRAECLP